MSIVSLGYTCRFDWIGLNSVWSTNHSYAECDTLVNNIHNCRGIYLCCFAKMRGLFHHRDCFKLISISFAAPNLLDVEIPFAYIQSIAVAGSLFFFTRSNTFCICFLTFSLRAAQPFTLKWVAQSIMCRNIFQYEIHIDETTHNINFVAQSKRSPSWKLRKRKIKNNNNFSFIFDFNVRQNVRIHRMENKHKHWIYIQYGMILGQILFFSVNFKFSHL